MPLMWVVYVDNPMAKSYLNAMLTRGASDKDFRCKCNEFQCVIISLPSPLLCISWRDMRDLIMLSCNEWCLPQRLDVLQHFSYCSVLVNL